MDIKYKIIITSVVVITAFALGRYTAPAKVVTQVKEVEVTKKDDDTKKDISVDKSQDYKKITKETKKKDGTTTITTVVEVTRKDKTDTKIDKKDDYLKIDESNKDKTIITKKDPINLGIMFGPDFSHGLSNTSMAVGGYVNKPVFGPITVGGFGFSNGMVGMSLGLMF